MASSLSCLSITNARGSLLLQASRDASSVKNRPQHHLSLLTKTNNINSCPLSSATRTNCRRRRRESNIVRMDSRSGSAVTQVIEKAGIKIVRNPSESHLSQLRVRSWPKWGCPPSKFPWTYSAKETCYLLEGEVKVYPDGLDEAVEIGAGDLVEFPKGMSCTWDVSVGVDKHYNFE